MAATPEARRGLGDVFGHDSPASAASLSPDERRFAAAEALRWALVRASERARGHRVVLAVDDLHCVDGASRNAFADALSDPPLVPALLVATVRARASTPGGRRDVATARVLTGLPDRSRRQGVVPGGAAELARLERREHHRSAVPGAALALHAGGVRRRPPGLADIIAMRVERLPADARRVLQAAAVWGDDADDEVLARMLVEEVDLVEALGFLRRAGMLLVGGGVDLRTSHPLVREVTLATIPAAVRRELHAAAAVVCDERDLPIEMRAMHEYWGGTTFQALLLLERVSVAASARGDHQGAIMALRRSLELARRELFRGELDDPMRAVLIFSRKLGEALTKGGQLNDAEGVLREALDIAGPSGKDRAVVLGALAQVAHGRDRQQEARDYLREAMDLASRSGAQDLTASLENLRRAIAVWWSRRRGNEDAGGMHIARWDLDKTYLRTEFDSLRDLVRTALERPDEKRTNPGASTLLREMVRTGVRVHILSGSPEQMRRRLEDKLRLDGITWDTFTLKPNLQNLLRLRFRAVRDQLGYKLPALLRARARLAAQGEPAVESTESLFGDDAEADAYVYSLYADFVAGRVGEDLLLRVLERGRVYDDVVAEAMETARTVERADAVERILIHLERQTPPDDFRKYGPRVVPFYNYLQAAFVLHEDGRLGPESVLRVAVELVTEHRFDGDALARSYLDLARRGHLRGVAVDSLGTTLDTWLAHGQVPAADELRTMTARVLPMVEGARAAWESAGQPIPDYIALVDAHNARRRRA